MAALGDPEEEEVDDLLLLPFGSWWFSDGMSNAFANIEEEEGGRESSLTLSLTVMVTRMPVLNTIEWGLPKKVFSSKIELLRMLLCSLSLEVKVLCFLQSTTIGQGNGEGQILWFLFFLFLYSRVRYSTTVLYLISQRTSVCCTCDAHKFKSNDC